ncbi:hypothetical protein ASD00_26805 [Ensifer sp. Root31]|uniref:CBASS cGAMP synthase n=1 Tax=Ensifer sp. Root31 TaxID=1736512 RepID=UPI0007094477|nr:hypothetical protein [Ensifer sp. Root31]KQU89468.1 hypothetical protein ASD00_26805 [Ensifer sp. Root31]
MTLANAHALFCGLKSQPSYLANLNIDENDRAGLIEARRKIRIALRAAAQGIAAKDEYWHSGYAARTSWRNRPAVEVKFMTQGSFAYGTINAPAQIPQQEIDLDDGMYVPVEFLMNGEPALAARGLFLFVETALAPLAAENGWKLAEKPNCVRIKLWSGAHIDIPIYSIPRDRFSQIKEAFDSAHTSFSERRASLSNSWRLPSDKIVLAQRDGTWIQSDPQQLHDWVLSRTDRYGPVYKRLSRFFKGWRDYTWEKCVLSSLCIMCAVDLALQKLNGFPTEERDDALVLEIAKRLPDILRGEVKNPVLTDLCINDWSEEDRSEIVRAAENLKVELESALERTGDAERVVQKLRSKFGERLPYRPEAIKMVSSIAAIQVAVPAVAAAPKVIPSTSG